MDQIEQGATAVHPTGCLSGYPQQHLEQKIQDWQQKKIHAVVPLQVQKIGQIPFDQQENDRDRKPPPASGFGTAVSGIGNGHAEQ